jgi:hypothetical protein
MNPEDCQRTRVMVAYRGRYVVSIELSDEVGWLSCATGLGGGCCSRTREVLPVAHIALRDGASLNADVALRACTGSLLAIA